MQMKQVGEQMEIVDMPGYILVNTPAYLHLEKQDHPKL